jgi:hypothetical protein
VFVRIGNGWNAVKVCSLESFNLFMWAKFVFALLTILQTVSMIAFGSSSLGANASGHDHDEATAVGKPSSYDDMTQGTWWSHIWISIIYMATSGILQAVSFILIRRIQAMLWSIGYRNDDSFVAVGNAAAAVGESSVLTLGRNLCEYCPQPIL